jgi:hypothetical protein
MYPDADIIKFNQLFTCIFSSNGQLYYELAMFGSVLVLHYTLSID